MTKPETQAVRMARMEEHIIKLGEALARNGDAAREAVEEMRALATETREETKAIRAEIATLRSDHTSLETKIAEAKATARGIGIGWAAAFAAIGGAIATGFSQIMEALR